MRNNNENSLFEFLDLGLIHYSKAEKLQNEYFEKASENHLSNKANIQKVLLLEHYPVYTLGKNGNEKNILPAAKNSGAEFYNVNRGGDITYHGPGQLVIYPILDLNQLGIGVAKYVKILEKLGIDFCNQMGLDASVSEGENGVWIDAGKHNARKIMAIGIRCSRGITMHGIAININTELRFFEYIIACGLVGKGVTSIEKELGMPISMEEVKQILKKLFNEHFSQINLNNNDQ